MKETFTSTEQWLFGIIIGYGVCIMLSVIALIVWMAAASAHDGQHAENNAWLKDLQSHAGGPCCTGHEAIVVEDLDWKYEQSHYWVNLGGGWEQVNDDAVVNPKYNRDGKARVWPINQPPWNFQNGMKATVRCFMPGVMG